MDKKILFLCTAHQNSEEKVGHVLGLLAKLKEACVDVCFSTHVTNGMEEISKLCKFVVFDSDNEFVRFSDAVNNLSDISFEKLDSRFFVYNLFDLGQDTFLSSTRFLDYHTRPALTLIKNGITLAEQHGYEWVVYMEYDTVLPKDFDIKSYFERRAEILEGKGSNGHFYICDDGFRDGMVWPFMFQAKTKLFLQNADFMSDWQNSKKAFLNCFGNLCLEEILERIARTDTSVQFSQASDIRQDMGYDFQSLRQVSLYTSGENNPSKRQTINESANFGLFAMGDDEKAMDMVSLHWVERELDFHAMFHVEAWIDGEKTFDFVKDSKEMRPGFTIFCLASKVIPYEDKREMRYRITIGLDEGEMVYCDFTLKLSQIMEYQNLKAIKSYIQ